MTEEPEPRSLANSAASPPAAHWIYKDIVDEPLWQVAGSRFHDLVMGAPMDPHQAGLDDQRVEVLSIYKVLP